MATYGFSSLGLGVVVLLGLQLCACAPALPQMTALERELTGTYQGDSLSLLGRTPYRLVLSVQQQQGKASGVLTNLDSKKIYALDGELSLDAAEAGGVRLNLKMYEQGNSHRGNLRAQIQQGKLTGQMGGLLFGHEWYSLPITLQKLNEPPKEQEGAPEKPNEPTN